MSGRINQKITEGENFSISTTKISQGFQYLNHAILAGVVFSIVITVSSIFILPKLNSGLAKLAYEQYNSLMIKNFMGKYKSSDYIQVELEITKENIHRLKEYDNSIASNNEIINTLNEGQKVVGDFKVRNSLAKLELEKMIDDNTILSLTTKLFIVFILSAVLGYKIFLFIFRRIMKKDKEKIAKVEVVQGAELLTPEEYYERESKYIENIIYISPLFKEVDSTRKEAKQRKWER